MTKQTFILSLDSDFPVIAADIVQFVAAGLKDEKVGASGIKATWVSDHREETQ